MTAFLEAKSPTPDGRICGLISQAHTVPRAAWNQGLAAAAEGRFSRSESRSSSTLPSVLGDSHEGSRVQQGAPC